MSVNIIDAVIGRKQAIRMEREVKKKIERSD